jgi:hypothetical protein
MGYFSLGAVANPKDKKKSTKNNAERKNDHVEAATALKNQIFLLSFYSLIDKKGNLVELEPEGNFVLVNKETFTMQKSVKMSSNTFPGSDNFKGEFYDFQSKESKKGDIQFSFVLNSGDKGLIFKGKMNRDDNSIEGTIKGKKEEQPIIVSGNIQPVKSHFDY